MDNKMRLVKFSKENQLFSKCCELAECEPTKRQASKFRNGEGKAFSKRDEAIRLGLKESGLIH
jgi:phosphoribosylpyrophosphate synthetase